MDNLMKVFLEWRTQAAVRNTEMENCICFLKMTLRNTTRSSHHVKDT